ncbi:MAG: peptide-methionine (S)-S-oxide reductase MsrA [Microcoleaceae cyanobacterium]
MENLNVVPLETANLETATFGAGCFWGVEAAFRRIPGVQQTSVGYMGGHFVNPCYLDVCARITGHAEVTQVQYDPGQVSYAELLDIFWKIHDPTSLNRQGPDRGEQYRSVIFYHTPEQERTARLSKLQQQNSGQYNQPIVTEIKSAAEYYLAEEEHQQYYEKRGIKQ